MSNPLIFGVDVSKGYADFSAIDKDRQIVCAAFQLDDNKSGHDQLCELIVALKDKHHSDRVVVGVESTGGLEDNWLRSLKRTSLASFVEGYRLNPKIIHHEYRVQHRNSISDAVSSSTIAHHIAKNLETYTPGEVVVNPAFAPARNLIRHVVSLVKACNAQKAALQQILYQYLPSVLPHLPDRWPNYMLEMLMRYPDKKSLQRAAKQGFKKLSRVPKGKAQSIYDALCDGIDMSDTPLTISMIIASKARQIQALNQEIAQAEALLVDAAPVDEHQLELLCSIKGMGKVTATVLLCFIEDVDRFEDAKSIAAFFGVQPRIKMSGDGKVKVGMSKQGSSILRRYLYLLAFRVISREPYLKSIYAKSRQKGMHHDAALGVLMHKLLRVIYGMLKSGTCFDAGVDQLNQVDPRREKEEKQDRTEQKADPKRRFQSKSADAPLSRRQRKERKKDQEPQAATVAESTGSS